MAGGEPAAEMLTAGFELALRLLTFTYPVVVACTGHAIAMGAFLVISGDYRIGADGPSALSRTRSLLGLAMPQTIIELCRLRLNPSHLTRVMALAETFAPEFAIDAGILDAIASPDKLLSTAREVASRLSRSINGVRRDQAPASGDAVATIAAAIVADDRAFRQLAGTASNDRSHDHRGYRAHRFERVQAAVGQGRHVRALVRPGSETEPLAALGVELVEGDITFAATSNVPPKAPTCHQFCGAARGSGPGPAGVSGHQLRRLAALL